MCGKRSSATFRSRTHFIKSTKLTRRAMTRNSQQQQRKKTTTAQNARWGANHGLAIGIVFVLWAIVLRITTGQRAFAANHTTFGAVVLLYLLGGPVAGALVGLCRPITRRLPGALLAGVIAGVPVAVAGRLALVGFQPPSALDLWILGALSLYLGPLTAFLFWWNSRRS